MLYFPDFCTVIRGVPRLVAGGPRSVAGASRLVRQRRQTFCPRTHTFHRCFQACRRHSEVLLGAPKAFSGTLKFSRTYYNHSHGTPVPVIRDPRYSKGQPECPARVWYSPEIDESKFTLCRLSDTPGGFQRLKYILLMNQVLRGCLIPILNSTFIEFNTTAYLFTLSLLISCWNATSCLRLARASKSNLLQCPSPM